MVSPGQLEVRTAEQALKEVSRPVTIEELAENEFDRPCGICQEQYSDCERPLRLPCDGGHVVGRQCAQHWLIPGETGNCPFCRQTIEVPPELPRRCSSCNEIIGFRSLNISQYSSLLEANTRLKALTERGSGPDEEFRVVRAEQSGAIYPYVLMNAVNFVCSAEILEDAPIPIKAEGYYNFTTYSGTRFVLDAIQSETQRLDGQTVCRQDLHTTISSVMGRKLDQITIPEVKAQYKGLPLTLPGASHFALDFIRSILVFTEEHLVHLTRTLLDARVSRQN